MVGSRVIAVAAAGLLLAGCFGPPPPPSPAAALLLAPGLSRGIDLPTDARDVSLELKASRIDFVARYYRDPASHWPALSAAEARSVSTGGMKLVVTWESHSHRPSYFSYASGYADALAAYGQARRIDQPAGSAIYFAVDFNAQETDLWGIDQYFRGVSAGFWRAAGGHVPAYRVGVYGSGRVCAYLKRSRLAALAWLSNSRAWSGYRSFDDWDIRQGERSLVLSFDQDSNEARGDYGAFQVAPLVTAQRRQI